MTCQVARPAQPRRTDSARLNVTCKPAAGPAHPLSYDAMKSSESSPVPARPADERDRGSSIAFYLLMGVLALGFLASLVLLLLL